MTQSTLQNHQSAQQYDQQARETAWYGPEAVFGLVYEFIHPGETLLDLGIGSGLSASPFHQAGLRVYGLDGSEAALEICGAKGIAADLAHHDLTHLPLPYPDRFFNHVLSVAVLNSVEDLSPLFTDIARIIQSGGILAFTLEDQKTGQASGYAINRVDLTRKTDQENTVWLYRHKDAATRTLLDRNGFNLLKTFEFVAFKYPAENRDVLFKAYVARKHSPQTD